MHGQTIKQQQVAGAHFSPNPLTTTLSTWSYAASLSSSGLQTKPVRTIQYSERPLL
jgi:hypothetical protein